MGHYYYFHIYDSNNEYIGTVSSKIVNDRAEQQSLDIAELLARKIDQRASLRALAGIIVQSGECVEVSLRVAITGLDELISVIEFVQDPSISTAVSVIPVVPAGVIKKIYKRFNGKKPKYIVTPAHVPGNPGFHRGKTVLPTDAEKVFKNAIPGDEFYPRTWYGINEKGEIYRFSVDNNGEAHFSGIIDKGKLKEYPRGRLKLKK